MSYVKRRLVKTGILIKKIESGVFYPISGGIWAPRSEGGNLTHIHLQGGADEQRRTDSGTAWEFHLFVCVCVLLVNEMQLQPPPPPHAARNIWHCSHLKNSWISLMLKRLKLHPLSLCYDAPSGRAVYVAAVNSLLHCVMNSVQIATYGSNQPFILVTTVILL